MKFQASSQWIEKKRRRNDWQSTARKVSKKEEYNSREE
jgi:hypothetical protein